MTKKLRVDLIITLLATGILSLIIATGFRNDVSYILLPTVASFSIFMIFSLILRARVGENLFGEIGFLYMALALIYTVLPAFTFLALNIEVTPGWVWENLAALLPSPYQLGIHLWRHVLFLFGISTGYLLFRGRHVPDVRAVKDPKGKDDLTILVLLVVVVGSILSIVMLSAPVHTYIENYTRFDHLSWLPRKFVSMSERMKQGFYVILVTFLFLNFKRYRLVTLLVVLMMCVFEVVFSFGSRIESLIVILIAICLYHYCVKPVTLKKGMVAGLALVTVFTAIEILRSYDFDLSMSQSVVAEHGMSPATELGAVYMAGFHLYSERSQGKIPPREWPMFFNDFISLFTPNNFTRWNPQYWYAKAYFPDAVVPPETLGPIADSAIWGGEIDLLIRSLVNGAFFAYLVRWFITRQEKWWALSVYVFCYATCIMTLKYSVFWHLNPLFKTFVPTILVVWVLRNLLPAKNPPLSSGRI